MADLTATLTAVWKGKQATTAAERDIDGFSKSVKESSANQADAAIASNKSGASFASMAGQAAIAGGALVAVGVAAKAAYDYIGEGAELVAAEQKFGNLAVSIDTTSDALLGKMQTATKGMLTDAELIASGTDIMSLGLAKTEGGVVRMASAVGALNLDMQVLALTMANDSTARLDNLGLSLEAVTKRKKELIASGFIGDAFDEAVLIELEAKMELLGDASQTTAGQMQILETQAMNTADSFKTMAAESGFAKTGISNLTTVLSGFNAVQDAKLTARENLTRAVRLGIVTDEGANIILQQAIRGDEVYIDRLRDVTREVEERTAASAALSNTAEEVNAIMEEKAQILANVTDAERQQIEAQYAVIESSEAYIIATAELGDKLQQQESFLTPLEVAQRAAAQATREHAEAAAELIAEAEKVTIIEEYNNALDNADSAYRTSAAGAEIYRQSQRDLADNVDVAADRVDNLTMKLLGIPPSVTTTVNVNTSAAEAAIGSLERKLFGIGGAASAGADQSTSSSPTDPFAPDRGGLATGGSTLGGGSFLVGETGPELVTLPSNSYVTNAQDMSNLTQNFNGVDPSRVMARMQIQGRRV